MVGKLAARQWAQVANALFEEIVLEFDERVGDEAECLPALANTVHKEAGTRSILTDMLAILLVDSAAGSCGSVLAVELGIQGIDVETEPALLDDLGLEVVFGAPNNNIGPHKNAPLRSEGEPNVGDVG